jgi:site-specific DNA-methyltransferase (adenine-specific)
MTKFMRFSLSLNKLSGYLTRGELKSVPFIDPSIEWTDDMLFRHFELTQEEINFINEFIGNWYQRDFQNIPE